MGWEAKLAEVSWGVRGERMVWKGQTVRSDGSGWESIAMSLGAFHPISRIHLISHSRANHSQKSGKWQCFRPTKYIYIYIHRRVTQLLANFESSPNDVIVDELAVNSGT